MITSNLVFSEWDRLFQNPMATAAAIDRVVHHSVILELDVQSYRTNEAKKNRDEPPKAGGSRSKRQEQLSLPNVNDYSPLASTISPHRTVRPRAVHQPEFTPQPDRVIRRPLRQRPVASLAIGDLPAVTAGFLHRQEVLPPAVELLLGEVDSLLRLA